MDPISQAVVGATYSIGVSRNKKHIGSCILIGLLSGMAADLDIFFSSSSDDLFKLDFHRQFTHSLIFIPMGAFICAFLLKYFFRGRLKFREVYLFSLLGYATHGLLDGCTSYGTQLFWPFSNYRVAWNNISIIDPLFTLPLIILIVLSYIKKSKSIGRVAIMYSLLYLSAGVIQRERAITVTEKIALDRGHQIESIVVKPSFGNIILWKTIYSTAEYYHVDAVRIGFNSKIYAGNPIKKLNLKEDFPDLSISSIQRRDIERFRWFSMGYISKDPNRSDTIIDMRFSIVPNNIDAMWGIVLHPDKPNAHVSFLNFRSMNSEYFNLFLRMLKGQEI